MTTELVQPKQNNYIPMQDQAGNRFFVNAWDVASRKAEGCQVVGDLAFHASSTRAPIEALEGKGGQAAAAPAASAVPADPAAERSRVKAIARAADDSQEALADKLIADGVPEAEALKALAADAAARKAKATKPPKSDAEKPVAPTA